MRDGEPSLTARAVAAARLHATRAPAPGGRPDDDERLARDVAGALAERTSMLQRHLEARTAFVDRVVLDALEQGVTQVIVAAAGYDGRALRYARPGVRWFELDHPDTQRDKRARLARLGITADDVTFVAADFRTDPVAGRLAAAGCDPAARSLVLAEGVAVYLEPDVLERMVTGLARATGPGSRLALTASTMSTAPGAAQRRGRLRAAVAAIGEPMLTALTADDADGLLRRAGWSPLPDSDAARGFLLAERQVSAPARPGPRWGW